MAYRDSKSFVCNIWALLTSSAQFSLRGVDKEKVTVFSNEAGGMMAEVGLLPFARVALQVATRILPPYRTRFSKHQFYLPHSGNAFASIPGTNFSAFL